MHIFSELEKSTRMLCSWRSYKQCKNIRLFANVALKEEKEKVNGCAHESELKLNIAETESNTSVKKYDDIPGPSGIFGLGTFYHYFPIFGKHSNELFVRLKSIN